MKDVLDVGYTAHTRPAPKLVKDVLDVVLLKLFDLAAVDTLRRSEPANAFSRRQAKDADAVVLLQLFDLAAVNALVCFELFNALLRRKPHDSGAVVPLNFNGLKHIVTLRHGAVCASRVYLSYKIRTNDRTSNRHR